MATASMKDIPTYFSFLFRSAETLHAVIDVVETVREKVTLIPESRSVKVDACQVEILEKVGFCVTVNPGIVKVWTKQVKDDLSHGLAENIGKIDLLMLFLFTDGYKSAITSLKLLFAEKQLVVQLFEDLMRDNTRMVYHLFKTICKFLDSLLRSRDAKCLDTVCELTVRLFLGLSSLEAQTLMGNMTSILVNFPSSRPTVLQILTKLASKQPQKLLLFAPYLMGVLEYVMQFPAGQIRSLMNVLAILAQTDGTRLPAGGGQSGNHFSAEFSILLRKQLTHSDIKIRCFGVFGAMASIKQMADQENPDDLRIRELLRLGWSCVERDEDTCSIFLDELASCTELLPEDICGTYRDILKAKFEELWTIDAGEGERIDQFSERNSGIKLVSSFDANKEMTEERLLINFENHPLSMSPLVVPAHMRVLALLESGVESGDLVGIDAILGCPILYPPMQQYYERADAISSIADFNYNQRYQLGQYSVLAINFFRESINAFVEDANPELRVKIWLRLENTLKLQKLLVKQIGTDGAGPSGLQPNQRKPAAAADKPKETKKVPKKKKKKARKDTNLEESDEDGSGDDDSPKAPAKKASKVTLDEEIQPKRILPYLRRFDQTVFNLLKFPLREDDQPPPSFNRLLLDLSAVSQNPVMITQVETFSPEILALLLIELKRQCQPDSPRGVPAP